MKKLFTYFLAFLMGAQVCFAAQDPAVLFVKKLSDKIITDVLQSKQEKSQKEKEFEKYFTEALDLKSIGRFVLGRYWRQANTNQRKEFVETFVKATTRSWSDRFDLYSGEKIVFYGERKIESSPSQVYVDSKIMAKDAPVEVIWRVKKKKEGYKIIDIVVENVSMALNYRNEYSAFLQANNGDVSLLIENLKHQKTKEKKEDVSKK